MPLAAIPYRAMNEINTDSVITKKAVKNLLGNRVEVLFWHEEEQWVQINSAVEKRGKVSLNAITFSIKFS